MNSLKLIMLLSILSIVLLGCTGITGNAAVRPPPPVSSGGGCGVAAPAEAVVPTSFTSEVAAL